MEEENCQTAVYAQVNMAMKRKNRRNSTSKSDSDREKKKPAPPQRPPPTPPPAYSNKKPAPPPVAPKKPRSQSPENSNKATQPLVTDQEDHGSKSPPTLPKSPAISKKASQLLAEKRNKIVPPKPIPYHIYIKAKEKRLLNGGEERGREDKENELSYDADNNSLNSS